MVDTVTPIKRSDYSECPWQVDSITLTVTIGSDETVVESSIALQPSSGTPEDIELHAEDLEIRSIELDGKAISDWNYADNRLRIPAPAGISTLRTTVAIKPQLNTQLSGLYKSGSMYCTQCEAEGFRRITPFFDRPDVMARYRCTVIGDRESCPVLLANGNPIERGELDNNQHFVTWEDPFPKPSYLFALVAGDLRCHSGSFTTMSGKNIITEVWVEPGNEDKCAHGLDSLHQAMAWDEQWYGREYDLERYMIVAVSDFNMGAMENKGLNIFNSKCVLASPETATDGDYESIAAVIAHEYFHNWTGNRVTCRDWFQLTLKEGLTVFRDQQFTASTTSETVKRIDDVRILRNHQFPEDAGPFAHPIRPESYVAMDNFYTVAVYEKGSEVIRLYHTLLGADGFRKGMDLYFERHDGQAVTCDDFRAAMADANNVDLSQFERWYDQAGTPEVGVQTSFSEGVFTLTLTQQGRDIVGQKPAQAWHIPVRVGFLNHQGQSLPLQLQGSDSSAMELLLELTEVTQSWQFIGLEAAPILSILRGFSAPVRLQHEQSDNELAILLGNDPDSFNRWEAGQQLAKRELLRLYAAFTAGETPSVNPALIQAWGQVLQSEDLDGSMKALALSLPGLAELEQALESVHPDHLYNARQLVVKTLAQSHATALQQQYAACAQQAAVQGQDQAAVQARRLRNTCLSFLAKTDGGRALANEAYASAQNMTDRMGALAALNDDRSSERDAALADFQQRFHSDNLVMDKWFSLQASADHEEVIDTVIALRDAPNFLRNNPNRIRALIGGFSRGNPRHFHRADGYAILRDEVIWQNQKNPQLASRLVAGFNQWRRYEPKRQELMRAALEHILASDCSNDVREVVERALS